MNNPRISLVHPTSNPFSRNAARSLAEANLLQEIITTTAYHPDGKLARSLQQLPPKLRDPLTQELARRTWIPPENIPLSSHPWQEILRIALVKSNLSRPLGFGRTGPINWVYASLDRHVAKDHLQGLDAVYAYEDGAATTFQAAKQQNILCLYDLPIPFYRTSQAIQAEEAQRFPELASAFQAVQEPAWKIKRKEQEIQLADHIFVASSFTKKSLLDLGINPEKISVIPYGSPLEYFQPQTKKDKVFRALFVGRVGPRKGVHYLLSAWQKLQLKKAELLLVGVQEFPEKWLFKYEDNFRHIPSVPHHSLNKYYSAANVLVFPSLVEGFGLVILEAMACGIPVITTPNTAGADIITDGKEGFIVPIRDVEALKEKIAWCYHHPQELAEMGKAARCQAEKLTWDLYRERLASKVKEIL
ncbi:MAG: glycosyltransferase family 4 protein [Oscillatoria sp. PMC 1068.18]|nr:glycosyltransferase family 4 protein [Oscillatoria sp. PMC 1076.18]MEC4989701.1 glycosyltransferase family 4 protein [Oscillatoria sp. PMC 1068.18]